MVLPIDARQSAVELVTLPALLEATVARFSLRPAIDFLGRRWSYGQLGGLVRQAARGLQDLGIGPGTKVGLCLPNTPYSVILYFAVLRAGGTVVNYNPLYVERELRQQVADSGTTVMVVPDLSMIYSKVDAILRDGGLESIIICPMRGVLPPGKAALFAVLKRHERARVVYDRHHVAFAELIANSEPPRSVPLDPIRDIAVLQYTGGTTGVPKGAMLSHSNLTANARQVIDHMPGLRAGEERVLGVLPLFHVFAMTSVMNTAVALGAEMVLLPRFELKRVIRCIEKRRPTLFPAVPTIYAAINAECAIKVHDLTSIRVCISGGAALPQEVRQRFEQLTGCKVVEGYGLSEASPVVACNPPEGKIKDGTVGLPMRDTIIEIRDPAAPHRLLGSLERGEVCVRGPQVMQGYWRRPAETAAIFVDGALRTGDIGYLDEDGYLSIVDRIKDVILCGGYNVYPRVIEEALYQHEAVAEAVVIGVPDSYRGQVPKAYVTLRNGKVTTIEELRQFLAGYLSKIEMPAQIEIRESLPKTMIGKLSKKELVEEERLALAARTGT
jgi:long-chain acyl-CoA synthetase